MKEVSTTTNGSWTLDETELTLQAFEATCASFKRNLLQVLGGIPKNVAYYEDLPAGELPKTRIKLSLNTPPPQESTVIWTGQMYVNGSSVEVVAYRSK